MTDQNQQQGYDGDYYTGDVDYLDRLAQDESHIKHRTYSMMRVSEGHTVLDVGCGPASDTIALSKLVGSTGNVIGIDHDPDMVATANQRAVDEGVDGNVEHRVSNGLELPFEDNTFDSCRSERVFQHVKEADKLLAEMIRVTKPGGYIVIADTDWSTFGTSTKFDEIDSKLRSLLMLEAIKNPHVTRKLYTMMRLANLKAVEIYPMLLPSTDFNQWRALAWDIAKPAILQQKIWTEEEVSQFENDLQTQHEQGAFYAHRGYVLVAGRKPE